MPQGIPMQFLLNSGESQVIVTSLTHIHSGLQQILFFKNFSIAVKCSKCLKKAVLSCFKQNHCISGMPQGIPLQFFAQHWRKSGCCDQSHTYSKWFAAKFVFLNFSIAGKCSKCLKTVLSCFKQNHRI